MAQDLQQYVRPELEEKDLIQARMDAQRLIRKYGMKNFERMFSALCIENVKLVKEINDHRVARGFAPLEVFKV
jgi:phosphopantetheine adenylyltransferase